MGKDKDQNELQTELMGLTEKVNLEASTPGLHGDHWQVSRTKWSQQNQYLLQHELYTDCVFLVGYEPNTQKFKAHKVLLSKVSAVFAAMLFGPLANNKKEAISIPLDPEIFQAVLQFVYTEKVDLSELNVTLELCKVADMYDLPGLMQHCVDHLLSILDPDNACQVFDVSHRFKQTKLEQLAWKMILERTDEVLCSDSFTDVLQSAVLDISTQEELNIDSEEELINACLEWAVCEALRRGLDTNTQGLRQVLGPILENLRFLCLTSLQFAKGPAKSQVLTVDEKVAFCIKICNPDDDIEIPLGFSNVMKKRNRISIEMPKFVFTNNVSSTLHVANCRQCSCCVSNSGSTATSCFHVDCNVLIHGLFLPAGNNEWQILLVDVKEQKILNTKNMRVKDTPLDKQILFQPIFVEYNDTIQVVATSSTACVAASGEISASVSQNAFTDVSYVANSISSSVIRGIVYTKC